MPGSVEWGLAAPAERAVVVGSETVKMRTRTHQCHECIAVVCLLAAALGRLLRATRHAHSAVVRHSYSCFSFECANLRDCAIVVWSKIWCWCICAGEQYEVHNNLEMRRGEVSKAGGR